MQMNLKCDRCMNPINEGKIVFDGNGRLISYPALCDLCNAYLNELEPWVRPRKLTFLEVQFLKKHKLASKQQCLVDDSEKDINEIALRELEK